MIDLSLCKDSQTLEIYQNLYAVVKCLRRRAVSTHSDAIGLSPLNVVRLLSSVSDICSNNLAIHSSANELLTTFTPVKSRTTRSFCSINGSRLSRTRCPKCHHQQQGNSIRDLRHHSELLQYPSPSQNESTLYQESHRNNNLQPAKQLSQSQHIESKHRQRVDTRHRYSSHQKHRS